MLGHIAKFRHKLDAGQVCLGSGVTFFDPAVTEALSDSVDFLWIDLEHNPATTESLQAHLIAARAGGAPALVRVPSCDTGWIKRVLDIGAEGIIVPWIQSVDEVRRVVAACRYPPQGQRGYGPRRPSNYGRNGGIDYLREANREVFVTVQIETVAALNDLDAILAVPGLDSVVIGPNDLSGSMGKPGQVNDPQVIDAVASIITRSRKAGRYVGIGMGNNEDYALQAIRLGAQWLQVGGDFSYLIACVDQLFGGIRKRMAE